MEGSPGGNTLLIRWVTRSRKNPAAFIFVVCPSRTNPAGFKRMGKQYVLEPRFGADPPCTNLTILKWRDPLGVRPCFHFGLTAVAKIRPLLYISSNVTVPTWKSTLGFIISLNYWLYHHGTPPWAERFVPNVELHHWPAALYQIWNSALCSITSLN